MKPLTLKLQEEGSPMREKHEDMVKRTRDVYLDEADDQEDKPLPKWEWLLISAAAIRAFFPLFIIVLVLIVLAGALLWGVVLGM